MASLQIEPLPAVKPAALDLSSSDDGLAQGEKSLRVLARAVIQAREEEARRIARELHDDAGQLLATVFLVLDDIDRGLPPAEKARLREARQTLEEVERRLRQMSHELRPPILDDLGLRPALEFLAESVAARTGMVVTVEGSTGGRLPSPVETAAYRIAQEALSNARKHAQATRVEMRVERKGGRFILTVRDNGEGFDPGAALGKRGRRGLGFSCMLERLSALFGDLRVRSSHGRGAELQISIPLRTMECAAESSSRTTTPSSARG